MTTGTRVKSPYGDGEILFPKHSGGFVVEIPGVGERLFEGSQLTVIEAQPATAPNRSHVASLPATISRPRC